MCLSWSPAWKWTVEVVRSTVSGSKQARSEARSVEENGQKSHHLGLGEDCVIRDRDKPCNDGSLAGLCKLDKDETSSSSFSVVAGKLIIENVKDESWVSVSWRVN